MTIAIGCELANRSAEADSSRNLLESVWDEVAGELSRVASAMGLTDERVQDVLQDVYLVGLQKGPQVNGRNELRRWLFRVTINQCNLVHRRGRRWKSVWQYLVVSRPTVVPSQAESTSYDDDERQMIGNCLQELQPLLRSILILRYFSELNSKEIGQILNLPDSTVRSHLRRARRQLAAALKRDGYQ